MMMGTMGTITKEDMTRTDRIPFEHGKQCLETKIRYLFERRFEMNATLRPAFTYACFNLWKFYYFPRSSNTGGLIISKASLMECSDPADFIA